MLLLTMSQAPFLTILCLPALRNTASLSFNQYDLGSVGLRKSVPTPGTSFVPSSWWTDVRLWTRSAEAPVCPDHTHYGR